MNIQELMTNEHIGKCVTLQNVKHNTISVGFFIGVHPSNFDGIPYLYFINGLIGDSQQLMFGFPVNDISTESLISVEVVA